MNVEMMPVEKIIPYARNPRKNDGAVDAVAASIKEFGFRQPIVVDRENVIIVGHTRYKAARKLGMAEVPVHVADMDPAKARAYRLVDNKSNELAEWDMGLLEAEMDGDMEKLLAPIGVDFDLEIPNFGAVGEDEQGRLDQKSPVKCPECGHEFVP